MSEQQKNDVLETEETAAETSAAPVVQAAAHVVSPGAQLASARKLKSLSVEDVASYLKLAPRQVHAIEADDFASLPGMAITRGFIRTYAKLLGMDSVALLDALPKQEMRLGAVAGSERIQQSTFHASTLPLRDRNKVVPIAIAVAVVVAVIAGGYYLLHRNEGGPVSPLTWLTSPKDDVEVVAPEVTPEVTPEVASVVVNTGATVAPVEVAANTESEKAPVDFPKFERLPVAGVAPATPAPVAAVTVAAPVVAPVATPAITPVVAPVAAPAKVHDVAPVAPKTAEAVTPAEAAKPVIKVSNSKDLLRLVMRQDAWVEIRRADGSIMFSRLLAAGTTESFDVPEPLQLVVGNADGVEATLRGAPLVLPLSKNNVARINLK